MTRNPDPCHSITPAPPSQANPCTAAHGTMTRAPCLTSSFLPPQRAIASERRIKALALPAFISIFVCNSTHLAQRRQIRALAVQLAGMTSAIALNALFIAKMGLGIRGAAIASVATQYGIVALQLVSLLQIGKSGGVVLDLRRASWSRCVRTVSRLGPLSVMYICKVRYLSHQSCSK